MKKQGDFYLKLISVLLAVVLVTYALCSWLIDAERSYTQETVLYCEVGDGLTVSGFVVRDEAVLVSSTPILVPELTEGARLAGGQRVATGYESADAKVERETLLTLQQERQQLSQLLGGAGAAALPESAVTQQLVQYLRADAQSDAAACRTLAAVLKPMVLRNSLSAGDTAAVTARIDEIDREIAALTAQNAAVATAISVNESGYFSAVADGYEALLTPDFLSTMNCVDFASLQGEQVRPPQAAFGKLIRGQCWYFVTTLPPDRAAGCKQGDRLTVSFAGQALQELSMTVLRIGAQENGACLLVLSCDRMLQSVTALRWQSADLIFASYEGLRVPKTALYHTQDGDGVYIAEGARARWKTVEVLYEYGDCFLVVWDKTDTDSLWPKDELLLTSEEIKDGMVLP